MLTWWWRQMKGQKVGWSWGEHEHVRLNQVKLLSFFTESDVLLSDGFTFIDFVPMRRNFQEKQRLLSSRFIVVVFISANKLQELQYWPGFGWFKNHQRALMSEYLHCKMFCSACIYSELKKQTNLKQQMLCVFTDPVSWVHFYIFMSFPLKPVSSLPALYG